MDYFQYQNWFARERPKLVLEETEEDSDPEEWKSIRSSGKKRRTSK